MKTKKIAIVSASALTAGMAQGAILYSNINQTVGNGGTLNFDLNQDGYDDYTASFHNNNASKPYLDASIGLSSPTTYSLILTTDSSQGLPLTAGGTLIDGSYGSAQNGGYFYQDQNGNVVGSWVSNGADVDGYVGLELIDGLGNSYYGWAHAIYNSTNSVNGNAGTLTLVDYAMETEAFVGIAAGQTAEPGSPPMISIPPVSQTNYVGGMTQLTVAGTGNPAPTYQWMAGAVGSGVYTNLADNGNIIGSTSNKLTLSSLTVGNQADYVVKLSNANGSLTNPIPATLTVAPLNITKLSPSPVLLYEGGRASIKVSYASSVPVSSFQWRKYGANLSDGGNISGSTSSNLVISALSDSDSADYSVVLTNVYGAVTSRVDTVTVATPVMPYQQAMSLLGPAAYYSFSETNNPASNNVVAFDYIGGFNGIYGNNTQNGNPNYAIAGPQQIDGYAGFNSSNAAVSIITTTLSPSSVVTIPALNLNTNTVTFTAWINPQLTESAYAVLISFRSAVAGTANGLNFASDATLGYHWNDDGGTYNYSSGLVPPSFQWSFVAMVISPTDAKFYVFNTGGMVAATNNYANVVQALNTPGFFGGDTHDPNFIGFMDEVAIFNKSLTVEQLTNLYNTAVTGIVTVPPPNVVMSINTNPNGKCVISWSPAVGTLLQAPALTGPWTTNAAASPYEVAPSETQMFYRVQVQ